MKFLIFVFTCFLVLFLSQAYGQIHVRLFQAHDAITQTTVAPKTHLENHIYFYIATPHQLWEISLEGSHQELLFVLPDEQPIETLSVADQSFLDSLVESTLITQPEYLREKLVQHIANIWTVGDDRLLVHVISQVCDRFSGYNWPACAGYSTLHLFNIDNRTLSLALYRWDFHQENQDASCDRPSNNIREIIPGKHRALIVTAPNCAINAPEQLALLNYKTGDVDIIPAAVSRPVYGLSPDGNSLAYIDSSACSNIACPEGTSVTIYRDGHIHDVPEIVVTPNSYRSLKLIWEDNDLLTHVTHRIPENGLNCGYGR